MCSVAVVREARFSLGYAASVQLGRQPECGHSPQRHLRAPDVHPHHAPSAAPQHYAHAPAATPGQLSLVLYTPGLPLEMCKVL